MNYTLHFYKINQTTFNTIYNTEIIKTYICINQKQNLNLKNHRTKMNVSIKNLIK